MPAIQNLQEKYLKSISRPDLNILLARAIRRPKEFILTHPEYPISNIQYLRFRWFAHRYQKGYSIAAITHHKEFYGLDFYVNRHVLIPRPETELVVSEALRALTSDFRLPTSVTAERSPKSEVRRPVVLIDVGTGTGCIPIAIADTLNGQPTPTPPKRGIQIFATDVSRLALHVAKKNAKKHGVKINFLHGNLLEPVLSNYELRTKNCELTIITANLPYLTAEQFASEPSIQREPRHALVADNGGLELYEQLLRQIQSLLLIVNCSLLILFEIDPDQSTAMTTLINKYLPQSKIELKKDLAGRDRLVSITV